MLLICIGNARLLGVDVDGWMLDIDEKVITVMCFEFLAQSVNSECM